MNFIILFGPPAVGKMTVGHALAQMTGLKLLHNHMTIELVLNFFPYGHPQFYRLVSDFRRRILEEVATSDLPGLIFTYVWQFDDLDDKEQIDKYAALFRQQGGTVYFVELQADQAERIARNKTPFRLEQKASKRNIASSEKHLLDIDTRHKLNTDNDFYYTENYIKINNTTLTPEETARQIVAAFNLPTNTD